MLIDPSVAFVLFWEKKFQEEVNAVEVSFQKKNEIPLSDALSGVLL